MELSLSTHLEVDRSPGQVCLACMYLHRVVGAVLQYLQCCMQYPVSSGGVVDNSDLETSVTEY